jgi:uncharacterized membrane protein YiaA
MIDSSILLSLALAAAAVAAGSILGARSAPAHSRLAVAAAACHSLLVVGLFNATLQLSEKGFYAMSFVLALFGAVAVQKNTRDLQNAKPRFTDAESAPSVQE